MDDKSRDVRWKAESVMVFVVELQLLYYSEKEVSFIYGIWESCYNKNIKTNGKNAWRRDRWEKAQEQNFHM